MEAAAEMVVDAARRHVIERDVDHFQERFAAARPASGPAAA